MIKEWTRQIRLVLRDQPKIRFRHVSFLANPDEGLQVMVDDPRKDQVNGYPMSKLEVIRLRDFLNGHYKNETTESVIEDEHRERDKYAD